MSIVQKLTEGIVNRDLSKDGAALISKWEKTGLLEGLESDNLRNGMASLLENQAKELLRESSAMAAGDVEGFAAVAFPLVRRVFGNLIANDLVSVQPMSLPSGLIFFLDFTVSRELGTGSQTSRLGYDGAASLFGGGVVGKEVTGGVDLSTAGNPEAGPYGLNNGYSSPISSSFSNAVTLSVAAVRSFTFGAGGANDASVEFDADFTSGALGTGTDVAVVTILNSGLDQLNLQNLVGISLSCSAGNGLAMTGSGNPDAESNDAIRLVRRLSRKTSQGANTTDLVFIGTGSNGAHVVNNNNGGPTALATTASAVLGATIETTISWPQSDDFANGGALGSVIGQSAWALENNESIPEIDIKIDSVAVTAITKKLKAKWTPELGQDLNAYHNLDAEVELTQILSEQIALEIDREILEDLIIDASAATRYWSRAPGRFLDRVTGIEVGASTVTPDFTGNVSEWYETLIETINDVSANIHRKTLRGGANFIVCGPEVANILEFTAGFRANVTVDSDKGSAGAVKVGSLSKKWDIYVDPYFLRSLVLVGRKGGSFLESGYVYAPYVPLQTTPTIFGVEDFVPRKGVMTRYAKQMVRPDMYGLVVIADMTVG
jgi:hypothetical protein|tara:strand:- start:1363 stop:3177 length:1815 start_codon:yes stop_codon:yes gene_type:complete